MSVVAPVACFRSRIVHERLPAALIGWHLVVEARRGVA